MITACIVILPGMEETLDCMLQSLQLKSKKISKVLVAVRTQDILSKIETKGHIEVEYFSFWFDRGPTPGGNTHLRGTGYSHAVGLHECLERVTSKYVMLTEPDIVFYKNGFDELYLNAMEEHNLSIIGVSRAADPRGHKFFLQQAMGGFPTVINCLMKTESLPDSNFLKEDLKMRPHAAAGANTDEDSYESLPGAWLLQTAIPKYKHLFPNPAGLYPVGCNLYLWYREKRWLSFHQEPWSYSHNHPILCNATTQNLNNFNLPSDYYKEEPLLYHSGHGGVDSLKESLRYMKNNDVEITLVENLDHTLPKIQFKNQWPHRSPYILAELAKDILKDKVFCDVGCAEGDQLAMFSKYAARVVGVELNRERGKHAVERGFDVHWGRYEETGLPKAHVYFSWIGVEEDAKFLKFISDNNIKCTVLNFCRKGNHLSEILKPYGGKILEFTYKEPVADLGWAPEGKGWFGITEFK